MGVSVERTLKLLILVSILMFIMHGIGTIVAVNENLPAEHFVLGSTPSGMSVSESFVSGPGTALSAPLVGLLMLAVLTSISVPAWRVRIGGMVGLIILGAFTIFGVVGERIFFTVLSPSTFDPAKAGLVIILVLLAILLVIFGVLALTRRKQSGSQT